MVNSFVKMPLVNSNATGVPAPGGTGAEPAAVPALDPAVLDALECYAHDARYCHVIYDDQNPRKKRFAIKWWREGKGARAVLYYPDWLEYYRSSTDTLGVGNAWVPDIPAQAPNPYGIIPVFHLRTRLRKEVSDLKSVLPLQDAISLALINMVVAGEFAALPQRYIIGNIEMDGRLKNAPNLIWLIPGGNGLGGQTQVGQFQADFGNFLTMLDHYVTVLAVITRTPKHYLLNTGSLQSGDALEALEAPLVKKVQERIDQFTPVWREVAAFLCHLLGITVHPSEAAVVYRSPATVQPAAAVALEKSKVDVALAKQQLGAPRLMLFRELGYSQDEAAAIVQEGEAEADRAAERARQQMQGGSELA